MSFFELVCGWLIPHVMSLKFMIQKDVIFMVQKIYNAVIEKGRIGRYHDAQCDGK